MRLVSVNVGLPREVEWQGKTHTTGIFKQPVTGSVAVGTLNLEGDGQADLSVHGGPTKAVYAYPAEHYAYWKAEFPDMELPWAMFGENLTTEGLFEDTLAIGDRFSIGTAILQVTEPRMPCYKLAIRFDRADIVRVFRKSGRSGFYFGVVEEGQIRAGDEITPVSRDPGGITVADITRLYTTDRSNVDLLRRAIAVEALSESWRSYFGHRLEKTGP